MQKLTCSVQSQYVDTTNIQHGVCYFNCTESREAAWPVTDVVYCSEGVAGAGQAAAGAVSEVSLLAVLTLQTAVARQTRTLTGSLVTFVRIQDPLTATAAVTKVLWVEERAVTVKRRDKKRGILYFIWFICLYTSDWCRYSPAWHKWNIRSVLERSKSCYFWMDENTHYSLYTYFICFMKRSLQAIETYFMCVYFEFKTIMSDWSVWMSIQRPFPFRVGRSSTH